MGKKNYDKNNDIIIFIKTIGSDHIPISIDPNKEVNCFFNDVAFDQHKQKLFYEEKELLSDKKFRDYSISNGSIISIVPSVIKIDINAHMFRYDQLKNIFSMTVNLTDKNQDICYGYPFNEINEIIIKFKGERLEKNKTFQDYSITNGSDILLYPKYNELSSKFYGINIPGNSTIKDLKLKYQKEKRKPINEQRLFIVHKELEDNKPFSFYSYDINDISFSKRKYINFC